MSDGGSIDLSLDSTFANTGENVTIATNPLSVECWWWVWQGLLTLRYATQIQSTNQIALYHTATAWTWLYNGVSPNSLINFTSQAWHHLVGVFDGANAIIYVDGTARQTLAAAPQAAVATILEVGTNLAQSAWCGGFLAELAIYNTTLSAGRVAAHFAAADNVAQAPLYNSAGGFSGSNSSSSYTDKTTELLADLFTTYQNSP